MLQVQIKPLRLVDVDPFPTAHPFLRITAPTGEVQTTSTAAPDKSHSKYSFAADSPVNSLVFEVDPGTISFQVAVFSREADSDRMTQYPGIGNIVLKEDYKDINNELTCPLLEDGDENRGIGGLIYTYSIVEQQDM